MGKEEKEDKPKKMFIVEHIIWDDGEIDTKLVEFRKTNSGRGAPNKWPLKPSDFKRRMGELLGSPDQINEKLIEQTGLDDGTDSRILAYPVDKDDVVNGNDDDFDNIDTSTPPPVVDEVSDTPQEKPKKKDKKDKEAKASDDNDLGKIDFGEFT